ncbi:MAG TPA: GT-D fold domain-containing glycosyltransferase, partial [Oscillospiraceae bacterium]|nr:GT-D fold domain-containing glycosyltransferase [Oscillospiraceae bacterium]
MKKLLLPIYNCLVNISTRLTDFLYSSKDFVYKSFTPPPSVMTKDETVNLLLNSRLSVSRLGDGEIKLIGGRDLCFQKSSKELAERLRLLPTLKNDKLLVCIPDAFSSPAHFEQADALYWKRHLTRFRPLWYGCLEPGRLYGNAFISRPYICFKEKEKAASYFDLIKRLWEGQELVIIEGEKSRLGVGNDLFAKAAKICRILGPSSQAFARYDDLLSEAKKQDKSCLFIIALGPVGSLLAADLSALGYRALDLGN